MEGLGFCFFVLRGHFVSLMLFYGDYADLSSGLLIFEYGQGKLLWFIIVGSLANLLKIGIQLVWLSWPKSRLHSDRDQWFIFIYPRRST